MNTGERAPSPVRRPPLTPVEFFREKELSGGAAWARAFLFLLATGFFFAQVIKLLPVEEQMNRGIARILAPGLDFFYPSAGREMITIIQVDDDDLDAYKITWPIKYDFHARRLLEIARIHPNGQPLLDKHGEPLKGPKAIFVDILFLDERTENLDALKDAFCRIKEANIPVYLASLAWTTAEPNRRTDAISWSRAGWCVHQVSVARDDDLFDYSAWTYPLTSGEGDLTMPAAATAIYTDLRREAAANRMLSPDRRADPITTYLKDADDLDLNAPSPLAVIWGATPYPFNHLWMRNAHDGKERCTKSWRALLLLNVATIVLTKSAVEPKDHGVPLCPYSRVLPLRIFQSTNGYDQKELKNGLANRVVIYGVSVQSAEDRIRSPLHGVLPGPHLHAMALDNMLSFKGRTKHYENFKLLKPFARGTFFSLAAILALTALMTAGRQLRPKLDARWSARWIEYVYAWRAPRIKVYPYGPLRRRYFFCVHTYRSVRFVLALALYVAVAGVIAYVGYAWFELGPLTWIEYALFFILAHFTHLGERLERWVSAILRHRQRVRKLDTLDEFKAEAQNTLTVKSDAEH